MVAVNWNTRLITIGPEDLTEIGPDLFELDVNAFRLRLKELEATVEGMPFPTTHNHNTEVTLGGLTFARLVELINDYRVEFEDGLYAVNLIGANNNLLDVLNVNSVSVRANNSAGLINGSIMNQQVDGSINIQTALQLILAATAGRVVIDSATNDVSLYAEDQTTLLRTLNVSDDTLERTHSADS